MFNSPIIYGRAGEPGYYDKINLRQKFQDSSDEKILKNHTDIRFQKYKLAREEQVNKRQSMLADLLECEMYLIEKECSDKLLNERLSTYQKRAIQAEELKKLVKIKESKLAEEKLNQHFLQSSDESRQHFMKYHQLEIVKDRNEMEKLKQLDALKEQSLQNLLNAQSSHLEEQLIKSEEASNQRNSRARLLAQENKAESNQKILRKQNEKLEEIKNDLEILANVEASKQKEQSPEEKAIQKQVERNTKMKEVQRYHENRRQEDAEEKQADAYCLSLLPEKSKDAERKRHKELRQEQINYLNYVNQIKKDEICEDKYHDQICLDIMNQNRQKLLKEKEKRDELKQKQVKEILEMQKSAIAERINKEKAEYLSKIQASKEIVEKQKQYEELIRQEEAKQRDKAIKYSNELLDQIKTTQIQRNEEANQILEEEKKLLRKAQENYQGRLNNLIKSSSFYQKLHPLRKAMGDSLMN
uniref:Trichohyalin-plectin-homology domain-containing protein n=1 Tax=Trichobilharzia regenti TaxID=157069 RepID=A0AA85K0K9_TRIRE|nr:unnamed protein product [Trichobilharzia regenti]